jgi:hypothetical protein
MFASKDLTEHELLEAIRVGDIPVQQATEWIVAHAAPNVCSCAHHAHAPRSHSTMVPCYSRPTLPRSRHERPPFAAFRAPMPLSSAT